VKSIGLGIVVGDLPVNIFANTSFGMFIAPVLYIWPEATIAKRDGVSQPTFEGHQNEQKYIAWNWNLWSSGVPVSSCTCTVHILRQSKC
jgi:hypothetical protein